MLIRRSLPWPEATDATGSWLFVYLYTGLRQKCVYLSVPLPVYQAVCRLS